jgi:hypothetical protein
MPAVTSIIGALPVLGTSASLRVTGLGLEEGMLLSLQTPVGSPISLTWTGTLEEPDGKGGFSVTVTACTENVFQPDPVDDDLGTSHDLDQVTATVGFPNVVPVHAIPPL